MAKTSQPQGTFEVKMIPPPVGGWNQRDAVPLMDEKDALTLENWIPDTNAVRQRTGYTLHATIQTSATAVETLMEFRALVPANSQLFAATPTTIWDVTAAVTASSTAAVVTGLTNGRWQHTMFNNLAGNWLVLANGSDAPRKYDGTTWSTCSVTGSNGLGTGISQTSIIAVANHMARMWFIEENKAVVWYTAINAVEGTVTPFPIPFSLGGKLMAMGRWTRDGGAGPDDFAVFVSSRGECIVYSGTNPASATDWFLVGAYKIPDVIGRRCLFKAGAELGILTAQGIVPLSELLGSSESGVARTAITNKISGYFRTQYFSTGTLFGWQPIEYPRGNLLIVNIPVAERVTQHQAVMNIITGAWCKFTNINGGCWGMFGDNLYFGSNDSRVYKFDSGTIDAVVSATSNIISLLQHAYTNMGTPQHKRFLMARPIFLAPTGYNPPVAIQTDYSQSVPTVSIVAAGTSGTQWDVGQWDTFQWAGGTVPSLAWQPTIGEGRAASVAFGTSSQETLTYNGVDIGFDRGGFY